HRLPQREPRDAAQEGVGDDVDERAGAQRVGEDRAERPPEEHREEADRDGNPRDPRGATHAHQWTTRSVHSLIQSLRFAEIVAGSIEYGCGGSTAHLVNTAGSFAPGTTGFTYIWSGMSSWNGSVIMKSRSACAPGTLRAPCN